MVRERLGAPNVMVEMLDDRRVKLSFSGGGTKVLDVPKRAPEYISDRELMALTVLKLAVPRAFPEETTGVDQAGYQVSREEGIHSIPGGRESARELLSWGGAILQARGRDSLTVASIIMDDLPEGVKAGRNLGNFSSEHWNVQMNRLRRTIAGFYPGAAAAIQRRKSRKIPDW